MPLRDETPRTASDRPSKLSCYHHSAKNLSMATCTAGRKQEIDPDELAHLASFMRRTLTLDAPPDPSSHLNKSFCVPNLPENISQLLYSMPFLPATAGSELYLERVLRAVFPDIPALLKRKDVSKTNKGTFVFMVLMIKCDRLTWQQASMLLPIIAPTSKVYLLSFFHSVVYRMRVATIMINSVSELNESFETKKVLLDMILNHLTSFIITKGGQPWL